MCKIFSQSVTCYESFIIFRRFQAQFFGWTTCLLLNSGICRANLRTHLIGPCDQTNEPRPVSRSQPKGARKAWNAKIFYPKIFSHSSVPPEVAWTAHPAGWWNIYELQIMWINGPSAVARGWPFFRGFLLIPPTCTPLRSSTCGLHVTPSEEVRRVGGQKNIPITQPVNPRWEKHAWLFVDGFSLAFATVDFLITY